MRGFQNVEGAEAIPFAWGAGQGLESAAADAIYVIRQNPASMLSSPGGVVMN